MLSWELLAINHSVIKCEESLFIFKKIVFLWRDSERMMKIVN